MGKLHNLAAVALASLVFVSAANAGSGMRATAYAPDVKEKRLKEVEAVAMQILIGPMLQSGDKKKMFGTGGSGKYWNSMLTEQIAQQIVAQGRFHLLPRPSRQSPKSAYRMDSSASPRLQRPDCKFSCSDGESGPGGWRISVVREAEK